MRGQLSYIKEYKKLQNAIKYQRELVYLEGADDTLYKKLQNDLKIVEPKCKFVK